MFRYFQLCGFCSIFHLMKAILTNSAVTKSSFQLFQMFGFSNDGIVPGSFVRVNLPCGPKHKEFVAEVRIHVYENWCTGSCLLELRYDCYSFCPPAYICAVVQ